MGDMIYLAAAYAVFWVVTFVFIYSLVSRQRNIQKDLKILEQMIQNETESKQNP
jgi:CcmD family protein